MTKRRTPLKGFKLEIYNNAGSAALALAAGVEGRGWGPFVQL